MTARAQGDVEQNALRLMKVEGGDREVGGEVGGEAERPSGSAVIASATEDPPYTLVNQVCVHKGTHAHSGHGHGTCQPRRDVLTASVDISGAARTTRSRAMPHAARRTAARGQLQGDG